MDNRNKTRPTMDEDKAANLFGIAVAIVTVLILLAGFLSSCNVTRTVTTTAQTIQRGDTTTIIQTKTIEQYDGKVDATKLLR